VHLCEHEGCAGNFRANFGRGRSFWRVLVSELPRGPVVVCRLCIGVINLCSPRD